MTDNKEKSTITVDEKDILDMSDKIRQNMRDDAEFAEQVDKFLDGKLKVFEVLSLGNTPNVLHLVGAEADTLTMNQSVLRNSMMPENEKMHSHTQGHDISSEIIKRLPEHLRNPILILEGQHPKTVIVITELKNNDNKNVIVPIALDLRSVNSTVNKITSIYGKNNIKNYLLKHQDKILAYNKEKTDELFTTIGYQLSKTTSAICFDNSIAYSVKNVNTQTLTKANIQKLEVNQSKSIINKLRENEKKIQSMDKAATLTGKKKDDMCK